MPARVVAPTSVKGCKSSLMLAQVHTQLGRDDVAERGLAQARRAKQQHMVQRLFAHLGGADEDLQLLAHLDLADVLVEQLGAQGALNGFFLVRNRGR
jgi:predicted negative regulator of RcsB-dependent stress response